MTYRCPGCYLPLREIGFVDLVARCWLCEGAVTLQRIESRSRWRRLLDRLTGMTF